MNSRRLSTSLITAFLAALSSASAQGPISQIMDPPGRVGRVSDVSGTVSLKAVGTPDWLEASVNYPLTTGDALWAAGEARAAVHLGSSAVHLAPLTSVAFDTIDDHLIRVHIAQGSALFRVRFINRDDRYEVSTPTSAISLRGEGSYRIDVTPDGQRTTITVRDGDADLMAASRMYIAAAGRSTTVAGTGSSPVGTGPLVPVDAWEQWADSLNTIEDSDDLTRYVSRDMVGYEELDRNGTWQNDATYGHVWQPRYTSAGWSPYRNGRWQSIAEWGWTWIPEERWGFATSHYGRWVQLRGQWCWIPGAMRSVPYYSPALVSFVSSSRWGTSFSYGVGGGVGWFPLGPGEPYIPAYRTSGLYLRNVNFNYFNVIGFDFATWGVGDYRYINYLVPGAVIVVPQIIFVGGQPVRHAAANVHPGDLSGTRHTTKPYAGSAPIEPTGGYRARAATSNGATQPPVGPGSGGRQQPLNGASASRRAAPSASPASPPSQSVARAQSSSGSGAAVRPTGAMRARSEPPPEQRVTERAAPSPRPAQGPPAQSSYAGSYQQPPQSGYSRPLPRQRPDVQYQAPQQQMQQVPQQRQQQQQQQQAPVTRSYPTPQPPPTRTTQQQQTTTQTQSGQGGQVRARPPVAAGGGGN